MALLPAGDDAPEVAQGRLTHRADIDMYKQEYYDEESKDNMKLVG